MYDLTTPTEEMVPKIVADNRQIFKFLGNFGIILDENDTNETVYNKLNNVLDEMQSHNQAEVDNIRAEIRSLIHS